VGGLAHFQSPMASVNSMSRHSLAAANPLMLGAQRRMISSTSRPAGFMRAIFDAARQEPSRRLATFSSTSSLGTVRLPTHVSTLRSAAALQQSRQFGSGGISRSILANREAAANRNPTSGTAQNAFYQALLMANMPALVVERYQSGQFASNEAADEAYNKALGMLSAGGTAGIGNASAISNLGLTDTQLQAVGQAVAAQTQGGRIAIAKGVQGGGGKDGPIHVVVDESFGGVVFRWVKFGLWFMLVTYLSLVVVTMALDGLNTIKRPTSRTDSETKAENQTARFSDVHGCDEAKEELQELVEFLRNPDKFNTLGGKLPKGVLLVGPPGTGKTLLARAVAGEAGVPFFYMSGSEFDEVYVGVGAKRVRDLFAAAKAKSPSIVFIDELDAVGGKRNSRDQAYAKQTLNQLLTELDGFEQNSGVIIIGATNFPKSLDKALTRPGRFDRLVSVPLPDMRGRIEILKHHSKKIKASPDVNLETIAALSSGMSGADLESIVNQAAVHATKAKKTSVTTADFDWARDKVIMGPERKTMVITPKEKEMTAYHEAGHALVSYYANAAKGGPREGGSQLYKVTILPRGETLGHTAFLPEMDKYSHSAQDYLGEIEVAFGGKLAEEMIYGNDKVTSGCAAVSLSDNSFRDKAILSSC
jgi:ATP-dependent metalloprotease